MLVCGVPDSATVFSRVMKDEVDRFGNLALSKAKAEALFHHFPEIYSAIVDERGDIAAYSSAFPLKQAWADALIAGHICETDLEPHMLLNLDECRGDSCVYIGSVVVADKYNVVSKSVLLASLLSWRVQQLEIAAIRRLSVVMTTATREGERMVRYVGARLLNDGANRKDGVSIFGRKVTANFLHRAASGLERCLNGGQVRMNFESKNSYRFDHPKVAMRRMEFST
jgi:hypothetical protein